MREVISCLILTTIPASPSFAQQSGDRIVVTTDNAFLKAGNAVSGRVPKGTILTVNDVNGEWL